jgi:crossover junction endodeoxyribonuclease RusA
MPMRLSIELPAPPKELSPNARVHYQVKARAVAEYREAAGWAAKEAMGKYVRDTMLVKDTYPYPLATPVSAYPTFYVRDRRRRDPDNFLASLKPVWDGFKDARLLVDDNASVLTIAAPTFYVVRSRTHRALGVRINLIDAGGAD